MKSWEWLSGLDDRLRQQLLFLVEVDRLKSVVRDTPISDGTRLENSAEHSWHLALFALALAEHAGEPVDVSRVVQMLLIHDVVEVDAGDASIFGGSEGTAQKDAESRAAERIFTLLPEDTARAFHSLWLEFENAESADAKLARALDSLQPVLLTHLAGGGSWTEHAADATTLRALKVEMSEWSPRLWEVAESVFADAVRQGWLRPSQPPR